MFYPIYLIGGIVLVSNSIALLNLERFEERKQLSKYLYSDYDPLVAPNSGKEALTVHFDIAYLNLVELDVSKGIMKICLYVSTYWTDERLMWNTTKYEIKQIRADPDSTWNPQLRLMNGVHLYKDQEQPTASFNIKPDGTVVWSEPHIFEVWCNTLSYSYPFDRQLCFLEFISWSYRENEVQLNLSSVEGGKQVTVTDWTLKNTDVYYSNSIAEIAETNYSTLKIYYLFKRVQLPYIVDIIIPNILLIILAFFIFFIPVESNFKITYGVTVFLCLCLNSFAELSEIDKSPADTPFLVQCKCCISIMVAVALLITVYEYRLIRDKPNTPPVPAFFRKILKHFAKIMYGDLVEFDKLKKSSTNSEMDEKNRKSTSSGVIVFEADLEVESLILSELGGINRFLHECEHSFKNCKDWIKLAAAIDALSAALFAVLIFIVIVIAIHDDPIGGTIGQLNVAT